MSYSWPIGSKYDFSHETNFPRSRTTHLFVSTFSHLIGYFVVYLVFGFSAVDENNPSLSLETFRTRLNVLFAYYYSRKNGTISIEIPQPHDALIQEHHTFPLMGPQVLRQVWVHYHVHDIQTPWIMLQLWLEWSRNCCRLGGNLSRSSPLKAVVDVDL